MLDGDDDNTPSRIPPSRRRSPTALSPHAPPADRKYLLERVDDAAVAQLYADGFTSLPLDQKILIWHLYRAALAGRDIYYDQRYAHNLEMRDVLEEILTHPAGVDPAVLAEIQRYTKLFWLNTGPHNNLTARKFVLKCTPEAFAAAAQRRSGSRAPAFRCEPARSLDALLARLQPLFFDPTVDPIVTNKTPGAGKDILDVERQQSLRRRVDGRPRRLRGAASRSTRGSSKRDGRLVEEVYRVGGKYDKEIREIVGHLEAAIPYATADDGDGAAGARSFLSRPGETADRVAYDIAWVQDKASPVDTINGFVEVYMDPRGMKGVVGSARLLRQPGEDRRASASWPPTRSGSRIACPGRRSTASRAFAASPPTRSTWSSSPATPGRSRRSGINLPNDQDIREKYGSKSVSLTNVNEAYDKSTSAEFRKEFAWSPEEAARAEKWSSLASELTTDLHEVIGHASGKIAEHLKGSPQSLLKEQYSALEESRADLVALYFLPDPEAGGARPDRAPPITTRSCWRNTRATRAMRSCSCAGSARARRSRKTTCATAR